MSLYDYCNGDPVNGLDPDGRCVESGNAGAQAGWNNGNGNPISYNPSSASNPTAYSLAWGFGRFDSYLYRTGSIKPTAELLNGVSQSINWGLNSTEQALGIPENSLTAAAFILGPEAGAAVGGLRAWGSLRAGAAAVEAVGTELELSPWPANAGFIEGTVERKFLKPGETVDRFGFGGGKFVSPTGTPNKMRSLRPGTENLPYNNYKVLKPFEVDAGGIAPAFNEPGMGTQYELPVPIDVLIKRGFMEKIQ